VRLAFSVPEPSLFIVPNSIVKFEFMFCAAGEGLYFPGLRRTSDEPVSSRISRLDVAPIVKFANHQP
jgi:hypothetical protein